MIQFQDVCIESLGYCLPQEIWHSTDVEQRLQPLYERLKLPAGRLELMTGIQERRFWPRETRPSQLSILSCRQALQAAGWEPAQVGALIHGSVCRDFLEPATACAVHHHVGLPSSAIIYDVSNACLGLFNGMLQAGLMIQAGWIESALVVGSEGGRQLVETTIQALNQDLTLTRNSIKNSIASLTIGSASCAVLLTHRRLSRSQTRLLGGACRANTRWHELCMSDHDGSATASQPLMSTDSHELMVQGVQTGVDTFAEFLTACRWDRSGINKTVCHQVGSAHRKMMLEAVGLSVELDYATFPWLGNTGAAALPITLAQAIEKRHVINGDRVALLGIGSGINCVMLGCDWGQTSVAGVIYPSDDNCFK
jgi:3-oxoacyl-[acyl-carrier-protein] synthase-3